MFKLEDLINNDSVTMSITFDYYPNNNTYEIYINTDKIHTVKVNPSNENIVFTSNTYGDLFIEVISIILKDLKIGKFTIEDSKIIDVTLTKNEFEKISARYEVHIYKQEYYTTKKVFKITQIS